MEKLESIINLIENEFNPLNQKEEKNFIKSNSYYNFYWYFSIFASRRLYTV